MSHIRVQNPTFLVKKPKCIVRENWEMTTMYIIHLFYIIHDQVNKIELLVDPLFQYWLYIRDGFQRLRTDISIGLP